VLVWLSVWSEMQTCIWPNWCHCHSLCLASVKSRLVLPFWYRLTRVVPNKGPLNVCVWVDNRNQAQEALLWSSVLVYPSSNILNILNFSLFVGRLSDVVANLVHNDDFFQWLVARGGVVWIQRIRQALATIRDSLVASRRVASRRVGWCKFGTTGQRGRSVRRITDNMWQSGRVNGRYYTPLHAAPRMIDGALMCRHESSRERCRCRRIRLLHYQWHRMRPRPVFDFFLRTAFGVTSLLIFGPVVLLLSELSEHNCESEAMMFLYSPHLFDFGRKIAQFMI